MKALSDLTKPTILFPRVCNYPFSALPLQQSPIPIPLLFTGEGEGTTNIKAAWGSLGHLQQGITAYPRNPGPDTSLKF